MPNVSSGVFPCYENQFKIDNAGAITVTTSGGSTSISAATAKEIADMEEYSVTFDNGVEEWRAYGEEGWVNRLMTSKSLKISVKGKRNVGDNGNDMVASCALKNGKQVEKDLLWTFPDGSQLLLSNAVINVTALNAAAATNVGPLEWEAQSNGKPVYVPAA